MLEGHAVYPSWYDLAAFPGFAQYHARYGLALLPCIEKLGDVKPAGDQLYGVRIVQKALEEPMRQIANVDRAVTAVMARR